MLSAPGIDPCAPTRDPNTGAVDASDRIFADCLHTSVTAAQYGNGGSTVIIKQCAALQCASLAGGNQQLNPEQSDSINVGINLTPVMLPGFAASIDYWQIKLKDSVGVISVPVILQKCLVTGIRLFAACSCAAHKVR